MPKYKVKAIVERIYETDNEIQAINRIKKNGFKSVDIIRIEKVSE